ncbi:hypothetical protein JOC28_001621 [Streptococcus loxodontisalivarius]|uniref:Type I toxin-antitoxin system Fst family toxin n=1 Tax=Streptococcus loxodontisalivarius TaxID=1349415 RepID=A0ABS2PTG8_9STRE|nr:hypothetical protein [Streptococcus loxodontisalivarius]
MSYTLELLIAITAEVIAGLILYFICKWLDSKK